MSTPTDAVAAALMQCEIGCLDFGGLHNGNDGSVHHHRQAVRLVDELWESGWQLAPVRCFVGCSHADDEPNCSRHVSKVVSA